MLYQAGASSRGRQFAAEHAEAVFVVEPTAEIVATRIADVRARAAAAGRDPYDVRAFSGFGVITAATAAEARRKHNAYRRLEDPEGTLALWSGWLGFDLAREAVRPRLHVGHPAARVRVLAGQSR